MLGAHEAARDPSDDEGRCQGSGGRLADHKVSLDAREREISLQEENLESTLCGKDENLEALVQQCTKELDDKHNVALDTLAAYHAA